MNAQEMFEKLGFKKVKDTLIENVSNWEITYETDIEFGRFVEVIFLNDKCCYINLKDLKENYLGGGIIRVELHQAITKQMEELKWL